jgi:hypothetical protein
MPLVIVQGGTIQCSHKGQARLPTGDSRLSVFGNGAVTAGMEVGISFAPGSPTAVVPCPFPDPKTGSPSPCTATTAATGGSSTILAVGNQPVLLETGSGLATNLGDPKASWSVADAGQGLLTVSR